MTATNLVTLPIEFKFRMMIFLDGVQISKLREVSKGILDAVDKNESFLYQHRVAFEYPEQYVQYFRDFRYRTDWKNVYIIVDQFSVAKKRAEEHKKIIVARDRFETFEKISFIVEMVFNALSGVTNFLKITAVGWAASREAISLFLKENPGKTILEAMISLGLRSPGPVPTITMPDFY